MLLRALTVWLLLMFAAIANGGVRNALLAPRLSDTAAHAVSTVMLCVWIALVTWASIGWMRPPTVRAAAGIGILWLCLTLAFEFLAGHYVFGQSWDRLLADYNLAQGRIWPLVLVTTAAAPVWAARRLTSRR